MIVYTGGTFDLFHAGHVNFLKLCAGFGKVVVALNSDEFVTNYKGAPPVMTFLERKEVLESCVFVSKVIMNSGDEDSRVAIDSVGPGIIAIGSDWARKNYYQQMGFDQDWLDSRNICLVYVPYSRGISSTQIKSRISN